MSWKDLKDKENWTLVFLSLHFEDFVSSDLRFNRYVTKTVLDTKSFVIRFFLTPMLFLRVRDGNTLSLNLSFFPNFIFDTSTVSSAGN